MKTILLLGGTSFVGRNLVERLREQTDYRLTLLNRGKTNPDLFPGIEHIRGDRDRDYLSYMLNRKWNIIIDFSCYHPHAMESILRSLSGHPEHYIFVSTCAVYEDLPSVLKAEASPRQRGTEQDYRDNSVDSYGYRKSKCETILRSSGIPLTIFRPALLYGKYDPTDRFYYWLHQVKTYQKILIPDQGTPSVSVTYVDDLVDLLLAALAGGANNETYNAVSRPELSINELVEEASILLGKNPELVHVPAHTLYDHGLTEWRDIPLWVSNDHHTYGNQKMRTTFPDMVSGFRQSMVSLLSHYDDLNWPVPRCGIDRKQQNNLMEAIRKASTSPKGDRRKLEG